MNKIIVTFIVLIGLNTAVYAGYNEDIAYISGKSQGVNIYNTSSKYTLENTPKVELCENRWKIIPSGKAKFDKVRYGRDKLKKIWINACIKHI